MKKIAITIFMCVIVLVLQAQSMATGHVFEDTNQNGLKDKKEKGISSVKVSNGLEIVLTDINGKFELPIGNDNIIFVIKPSGYKTHTNEYNLPVFYYNHKPNGSFTGLKYQGVKNTGVLPENINFALVPQKQENEFKALIFGDPQVQTSEEVRFFEQTIIEELKDNKIASFGISMGDLVFNDLSLNEMYKNAIKKTGLPWYNVMGNHDMNFDVTADSVSDETFEANFGPANYAFEYAETHFIVLDNILYPDPRKETQYWGGFRENQLRWIENDLKLTDKNKLIVLAMHIPLLNDESENFSTVQRQKLFDLLKDCPNILVLSAHTHLQRQNFYTQQDGWYGAKPLHEYNLGTTCGDWYKGELDVNGFPQAMMYDGTPKGYAYLNMKGNQYSIEYKVMGEQENYQMRIQHPKVIPNNRKSSAQIVVNFFIGSPNDKVEFRVDNREWKPMTNKAGFDPYFAHLVSKWDFSDSLFVGRRPSNPEICNHLWVADIPFRLKTGEHTIQVKATDMFGNEYIQESKYTISLPAVK